MIVSRIEDDDESSSTTVQFMNVSNLFGTTKSYRARACVFALARRSRSFDPQNKLSCGSNSNAVPWSIPWNTLRREGVFAYDHNAWFINNGGEQTGLCWSSRRDASWWVDSRRINVSTTLLCVPEAGLRSFVGRTIPSDLKPEILTKRIICIM